MARFKGLKIGLQSHTLHHFGLDVVEEEMKKLQLKHIEFPRPHLPIDNAEKRAEAMRFCSANGIKIDACGVMPMPADEEGCRAVFEHAKALGVEIISIFPELDAFPILNRLVKEYGIRLAIHNAGPDRTWSDIESVERGLAQADPMIGACLDTGHFTRMGIDPIEALCRLGDRVFVVHLKDRGLDRDGQRGEEYVIGDGPLDLEAVLNWLLEHQFTGPIYIEYEKVGHTDARPELHEAVARIERILS